MIIIVIIIIVILLSFFFLGGYYTLLKGFEGYIGLWGFRVIQGFRALLGL